MTRPAAALAVALAPVLLAVPIGFVSGPLPLLRPPADTGLVPDASAPLAAPVDARRPPLRPALPYAERLVLDGAGDGVLATFETTLVPPEVLRIVTSTGEGARGALVVDVLQPRGAAGVVRLASVGGEAGVADVRWSPPVAGPYRVRVHALPGSVGAFGFALDARAPLDFPVATDATDAVRSFFGDARDGGRRDHHGIDVFAPRGTPVLAAADGLVARVATSARGGLHVWQRAEDETGRRIGSLYYAHLDSVAVLAGTRVRRGETLGTVGNSGNARTTPPHLHFGLYRRFRGPEDPLPLVGRARPATLDVGAGHALAPWLAVTAPALNLRAGPGTAFDVVARLGTGALVQVLGVVEEGDDGARSAGRWVRIVAVVDGGKREGFVARSLLAPASTTPLVLDAPTSLRTAPHADAPRLVELAAGTALEQSGRFDRFRRVVTDGGLRGWIADADTTGAGAETSLPDG